MQAKDVIDQLSPNSLHIGLEITLGLLSSLVLLCAAFILKTGKKYAEKMDERTERIEQKVDKMGTNCFRPFKTTRARRTNYSNG